MDLSIHLNKLFWLYTGMYKKIELRWNNNCPYGNHEELPTHFQLPSQRDEKYHHKNGPIMYKCIVLVPAILKVGGTRHILGKSQTFRHKTISNGVRCCPTKDCEQQPFFVEYLS